MKQKLLIKQERRSSSLLLKMFALVIMMVAGVSGVWADDVLFSWHMTGTTAPSGSTNAGTIVTGQSIAFNTTANDKSWGIESATYNASVTDNDLKATNGKGVKCGRTELYLEFHAASGVNFQAGDIVYICGYGNWLITTNAGSSNPTISGGLSTGGSKSDYNVNSIAIPNNVSSNVIYLAVTENSSHGISGIKVVRPSSGYTVSVSSSDNSKGRAYFTLGSDATQQTSNNNVSANTTAHFYAQTYAENIVFSGWKVNGADNITRWNNPTDIDITENTSLQAVFTDGVHISCTVDPAAAATPVVYQKGHEEWGLPTYGYVNPGTNATFSIKDLQSGYEWVGWYDGSGNLLSNNTDPYTIDNITQNVTMVAKFRATTTTTYSITWDTSKIKGADAWYTLGNDNTQYRESKSDIPAGTKVVCHAQDNDGSYTFFNRWFDANGASYGWGNRNYTFTEGIDKNLTIGAEFFQGRIYVGNVQGGNGTVEVHTWNGDNNAFNDNNINGQKEIWANHVQFEAKANTGYEFVRWAEDNSTNRLLELTDVPTAQTITRTAIFQQIPYNQIGTSSCNTAWNANGGADAFSNNYTLQSGKEYKFEFDVHNNGSTNPWESWILMASQNQNETNTQNAYYTLRADNFVYEQSSSGHQINNLALVGGALDWETYKRDLDGAHVTIKVSFDGETLFTYTVIENNGRTYTDYFPSKKAKDQSQVNLRVGVDNSMLTNFTASVADAFKLITWVKDMAGNVNSAMGSIVITSQEGVTILEGSSVGRGTRIRLTATANSGYVFDHWSNSSKEYYREFEVGSNGDTGEHNFSAHFKSLSDFETTWNFENLPSLCAKVDDQYVDWTVSIGSNGKQNGQISPTNVTFSGIYNSEHNELSQTSGLLFNNKVFTITSVPAVNNMIGLYKNEGVIKIPVVAGEVVTVEATNINGTKSLTVKQPDGTVKTIPANRNELSKTSFVAVASGYIELINGNADADIYVKSISKTAVRDFTFADGSIVPAQPGCDDYINHPIGTTELQQQIVERSTFTWTSSNPADVSVDPSTGNIIINNSFSSVQITATMNEVKENGTVTLPAVAKSYTLITSTNKMKFNDEAVNVTLNESGSATYWQKVSWTDLDNIPSGDINYSIVSTTAKAEITTDDNGDGSWNVTVFGKGVTVVKATCGALSATYTITSSGLVFDKSADVYDFSGSYQQEIPGASYRIVHKYGAIAKTSIDIDDDGSLTNLPLYDENKGGAIVVEASATVDGATKTTSYVLTFPYKKYVWNFYKQGLTGDDYNQVLASTSLGAEGNNYHFVFGDLLETVTHPGSAPEQPATGTISNTGSTYPDKFAIDDVYNAVDPETIEKPTAEQKKNYNTQQDLKKMLQWRADQALQTVKDNANDPHNYFNYTYKTLEHQLKEADKPIQYTNEALFSYVNAINGDNARIISDTQGLLFTCAANKFGFNDNLTATARDMYEQDTPEQDRAILLRGYSSFTVPHVTEGHYIKIHWYRHAPNAGDQFYVTNAKDLDGKTIDPTHKLRFTSCHYTHHNYEGSLILQAASTGDVIIKIANENWTELYRIEVTDTYESDQKLCETAIWANADGSNRHGDTSVAYERDINEPGVFNAGELYENRKIDDKPVRVKLADALVNKLVSRVHTHANGGGLIESPTPLYFTGYAAQNNTWNGWMNNNVQVVCEGTASCDMIYDSENGISNILPTEYIRVGENLDYPMFPLRNISGVGTIKLIARTITGFDGEPHYTLNKQIAYVPVGEYSVQDYPYTWDFTNYNTGLINAYSTSDSSYKTFDNFNSDQNAQNHYGSYTTDIEMSVNAAQNVDGDYAYIEDHKAPVAAKRNKRFFAQGSQLALGDNNNHTILETEGLRFNIPAIDDDNNGAVSMTQESEANTLDKGYLTVSAGSKITIPEVDKDMYVFVKSNHAPTFSGTTDANMEPFESNTDGNVTYYKATGDADGNKADVVLTFDQNTIVYKIGVTKEVKAIAYFGYATESRAVDIDYNETRYFSANTSGLYLTSKNGWGTRIDGNKINPNVDLQVDLTATPIENDAYIPQGTGIILKNNEVTYHKEDKDKDKNTVYKIPLFVPACNVPETNTRTTYDYATDNLLTGSTNKDKVSSQIETSLESETHHYYIMSNRCIIANYDNNEHDNSSYIYTDTPRLYRYIGTGEGTKQYSTLKNLAYLEITGANAKALGSIFEVDFESISNEATNIEEVDSDIIENANEGTYYNLRGQALNGKPTAKGVYINNGKKYYVK